MDGIGDREALTAAAFDDPAAALHRLLILGAVFVALMAATPPAYLNFGDNAYMVLAIAAGLTAFAATRVADRAPQTEAFWLIVAVALLVRLVLLFVEPLLSNDIYRYVWDGRVQGAGINPYRYYPAAPALAGLRDAAIYPYVNRADYAVTIYPPVAQMFFFLVTRVAESVTVMKLALLLCEGGTVAIIVLLLRRLGRPMTRIAAYLWHPLPIWEISSSGHIDALMIALMMGGVWLALGNRRTLGAVGIALGALAKPFAAPALALAWRPWDWKLPLIVVLVAALCYAPYLSVGWGVFGFLTTGYAHEEQLDTGGSIWLLAVLRLITGHIPGDTVVYLVGSALAVITMGTFAARLHDRLPELRLAALNRVVLLFLVLMPLNYPWYFLVAVPFLALTDGVPGWALTIGALLLQEEYWGDFQMPLLLRKSILYGAFFAACAYELWQRRHPRGPRSLGREYGNAQ